ncbi:unnamed protein product [Phytomonas sp. EM1]|nr:unnamed protein product [Phytomonas sp. EM1]|eukprot:CCW60339.1 unnamed protein product [Phytomonas sp. isolate EM1]
MLSLSRVFVSDLRRSVNHKTLLGIPYNAVLVLLTSYRYLSTPTKRDLAIQRLSEEVFSRGNMHLKNVYALSALPEGLHSFPEVCFIGKPNVGKSTLISCLLHNPKLGRGSSIAGSTRSLQFFNVGDALLLVDTPGYGGWGRRHLPQKQSERAEAFSILFRYLALRKRRNLKRVYWLIEASATTPVSIQARDEEILTFLRREGVPFSVILTKIDRHRRYYLEEYRKSRVLERNGLNFQEHTRNICSRIPTPLDGLRRNVQEVYAFLATDSVPIFGVSANRQCPMRCENLSLLQHDIVHYCTQELSNESQLTYADLHELSYFPPSAEEILKIQIKYPIEAFIVPQDNRISLNKMVDMHEDAKARYVTSHSHSDFLTTLDAEEGCLLDSRQDSMLKVEKNHEQHGPIPEIHPPSACMSMGGNPLQFRVNESTAGVQPCSLVTSFSLLTEDDNENQTFPLDNDRNTRGTSLEVVSGAKREKVNSTVQNPSTLMHPAECSSSSSIPTTLLSSLEPSTQTVMAINGVHIPRSMISTSVEELVRKKDDEFLWFEGKSGARAYDKIIAQDHLVDRASAPLFVQHDSAAQLSDAELDSIQRVHVRSAARRRKERLLEKYIDKKRKDRSIYMQAESYMCPWLAGVGQDNRQAVVGLSSITGEFLGKGCVLKGLKRTGFGGKSYSAKTLRNRGRSTKKTGFWAA